MNELWKETVINEINAARERTHEMDMERMDAEYACEVG